MTAFRLLRAQWRPVALFLAISAIPTVGSADLRFCNRTASHTTVAVAYVEKDAPGTTTNGHRGVTVEGWWGLDPNECNRVADIDAGNHWVYYYAHSPNGKWAGDALLCVPSHRFTLGDRFKRQGEACPAGYHLEGFRRHDATAKNYTINLK